MSEDAEPRRRGDREVPRRQGDRQAPRGGSAPRGDPAVPLPGRAVRGSTTGRPIMALLDLLGRRWALRVIWELRDGPLQFRPLQERCAGMSSSVLNQRLHELRTAGIVELGESGYQLTDEGLELREAFAPLDAWARSWGVRRR